MTDRPYIELGESDRPVADQHRDTVELLVRWSLEKLTGHLEATVREQARIVSPLVAEEIMEKAYYSTFSGKLQLMGAAEVVTYLGLNTRQRLHGLRRAKSLKFPQPVQELAMGPVWLARDIEVWEKTWERKTGRPRKAGAAQKSTSTATAKQ